MYEQHLKTLNCTVYSTVDEIKASYRSLAMKLHPDLNTEVNPEAFRKLTEAYDWLLANHKPKKRPPDTSKLQHYYRYLEKHPFVIRLPYRIIDEDICIHCMFHSGREFKIILKEGTEIPTTLMINNLGAPFKLSVLSELPRY